MSQLYGAGPVNEPGEDDLGALSSWYVWSAIGLYPETPGVANLALAGPLFPKVTLRVGDGHVVTVVGTNAPDTYILRRQPRPRHRRSYQLGQAMAPGSRPAGRSHASRPPGNPTRSGLGLGPIGGPAVLPLGAPGRAVQPEESVDNCCTVAAGAGAVSVLFDATGAVGVAVTLVHPRSWFQLATAAAAALPVSG